MSLRRFALLQAWRGAASVAGLALLGSPGSARAADPAPAPLQVVAPESLGMYGPLIASLLADAGVKAELKYYPTARSRALFVSGQADAEFFRVGKLPPDYPSDVIFIGPMQWVRFGFFAKSDAKGLSEMAGPALWSLPMGYVRGTLGVEEMLRSRGIRHAKAVERGPALRMLLAGRFSVVLDGEGLFMQAARDAQAMDRVSLLHTVRAEPTYLLLRGKHAALEAPIRRTLQAWLDSGRWQREFQEINQRNGLPPDLTLVKPAPAAKR